MTLCHTASTFMYQNVHETLMLTHTYLPFYGILGAILSTTNPSSTVLQIILYVTTVESNSCPRAHNLRTIYSYAFCDI